MRHPSSRHPTFSGPGQRAFHRPFTRGSNRSGQALIEFAVIAFVMTLLLGAMLTFGFMLFGANVLQQAADVGAQELARHPYSPTGTFSDALEDEPLFTEAALVVAAGTDPNTLPLINRLLFPLYIYDQDIDMVRYPGTLVTNGDGDTTVVIPIVGSRDSTTGVETISEWRRIVEEIIPEGEMAGPYSLGPDGRQGSLPQKGWVAMRINYPYQSGSMVAYVHTDQGGNILNPTETIGRDDVLNVAATADDASVQDATSATFPDGNTLSAANYTLVDPAADPSIGASPHRGTYGFGEAQAHATTVRPYRKVLTAQGIYRREVFE
ncbi:MAG: TadE/TadG family type IV pilus assembly protein [Planctomycetota bacterium]|jgi:hypothetical protein